MELEEPEGYDKKPINYITVNKRRKKTAVLNMLREGPGILEEEVVGVLEDIKFHIVDSAEKLDHLVESVHISKTTERYSQLAHLFFISLEHWRLPAYSGTMEATERMKAFPGCAYQTSKKEEFQRAAQFLFGEAFIVTVSMQNRMQFTCTVCNKDMNCVNSMSEHSHSGAHQKNVDRCKSSDRSRNKTAAQNYSKNSLQYKLLTSSTEAIGLQMVEAFQGAPRTKLYFKCNLCGAHGRIDSMYFHLIGTKHTEKYIKKRVNHPDFLLKSRDREEYRKRILNIEGSRLEEMRLIEAGESMFPYEWLNEGLPKGNQVTEETTCLPDQDSQDNTRRVYKEEAEASCSGVRAVDCVTPKSVKTDTQFKACQTRHENPFENIMTVLSTHHEMMLDDRFCLRRPEQALVTMHLMFPLAETLYEASSKDVIRTAHPSDFRDQQSWKKDLNKFLGLLQHILIPVAEKDCQGEMSGELF
ncbi:uncharacterized protein LOC122249053 [Penaeus japonicus]|uniref:uncharacterized protein LOC122249053 n=1 Tax=Penaeus japonicus TaxID=27405 RepID=UPI001C7160F3|nr:uncharacterized protein LOC122249053 [Penaeus japonicus]